MGSELPWISAVGGFAVAVMRSGVRGGDALASASASVHKRSSATSAAKSSRVKESVVLLDQTFVTDNAGTFADPYLVHGMILGDCYLGTAGAKLSKSRSGTGSR